MVSNGYFSAEAFSVFKNYIHGFNIDLKCFSEKTYQTYCNATLKPVLDNLVRIKENSIHLEVTTLLIPDLNDSVQEIKKLVKFLVTNLGIETIWHISAFHPAYQLDKKTKTPISTLDKAYQIGKELGLQYIYYGNVLRNNSTFCPSCLEELVKRNGYAIEVLQNFSGICPKCGKSIIGIW